LENKQAALQKLFLCNELREKCSTTYLLQYLLELGLLGVNKYLTKVFGKMVRTKRKSITEYQREKGRI
jgi:hypothetical protein